MRKNKLFRAIAALTLGLTMTIGVSAGIVASRKEAKAVYAASPATLTFEAACGGTGTDNDGNVWTVTSDANESNFDNSRGIHYGTNSASVTYINLTTSDISGTITSVVVNASDARGTAVASVTVGETAFECSGSSTVTNSTPGNDYTFTGSATGTITVDIRRPASNTKAIYCKSIVVTYSTSGGGDPDPVTYTGVEVSEKTALTGTYKGYAYYECQATVSGTGSYSSTVAWSITDTDTYGTGKTIADVATISDSGRITFLDNVDAIYVWATAADGTTHNASGFSVSASGLLSDSIPSWTKITDSDDVSVNKVYALSNDGINFGGAAVSSSQISLTTRLSVVGYIVLESTTGGYYARFATYENDAWTASGKYINNGGSNTSFSGDTNASTVWTLNENGGSGVYLKNSSNRFFGISGSVIKAYSTSNNGLSNYPPAYLWEVDSLPVATCATIELNGVPNDDMSIGDKATLSYTAYDSELNEWTGDVTYSITTELDENGDDTTGVVSLSATSGSSVTLTALKPGTAEISVQDKDQNATADTATVTVLADPERLELPIGNYTVVIDASEETSSTLPSSRDYEIKAKEGRTWYQNLTVNFSGITVLTNYGEYESAKSTGALTVTNNSNARISSVEVHYYKYENDGVGVYVNDSILTPTSSSGTSVRSSERHRAGASSARRYSYGSL